MRHGITTTAFVFIVVLTLLLQRKRITKPEGRRRTAAEANSVRNKNKRLEDGAETQDTKTVVEIGAERFNICG